MVSMIVGLVAFPVWCFISDVELELASWDENSMLASESLW